MDITCYVLLALALVLGFIGVLLLWFTVVRNWRRANKAEARIVELELENAKLQALADGPSGDFTSNLRN